MKPQVEIMDAARYNVRSVVGVGRKGLAIEFTVRQPSGQLGQLPAVYFPDDQVDALVQAIQDESRRLRRPH